MMKLILFLVVMTVASVLAVSGCSRAGTATPGMQPSQADKALYRSVTAVQLQELLQRKDFLLVNVHSASGSEISGTDRYVPYDRIEENVSLFPADKGSKIVVYCRSGSMSAQAARDLARLGFTNVWDLDGGMIGWEGKGYQLRERP